MKQFQPSRPRTPHRRLSACKHIALDHITEPVQDPTLDSRQKTLRLAGMHTLRTPSHPLFRLHNPYYQTDVSRPIAVEDVKAVSDSAHELLNNSARDGFVGEDGRKFSGASQF